jgi:hypothetical protein
MGSGFYGKGEFRHNVALMQWTYGTRIKLEIKQVMYRSNFIICTYNQELLQILKFEID